MLGLGPYIENQSTILHDNTIFFLQVWMVKTTEPWISGFVFEYQWIRPFDYTGSVIILYLFLFNRQWIYVDMRKL